MHHQFTRRNFFQTAGLSLAAIPLRAIPKPVTPVPISPALLQGVSLIVGRVASRIRRHTATPQDMQTFAQALNMLSEHLEETGFNQALKLAAARYAPDEINVSQRQELLLDSVLAELRSYDPGFTADDLAPLLQADTVQGMAEISQYGLSRILAHPQDEDGNPDAGNLGPDEGMLGHICPVATYYIGGFGAAAFVLQALGCTPEPAFAILCPTISVVNLVLGAAAVAVWVLC